MHPIMFRIPLGGLKLPWIGELGNIPIYSYGVMLGLSLVVGWYLTLGLAARDGLPRETMANNYVITAVAAVASSRILYILTNLGEFKSWGDVFSLREGGLVAYGGFLGGFLGSWIYLRIKRIRLMPWADVAVPSLASGLLITRIGCYLYGCDYGKPLGDGAPGFLRTLGTFPHWPDGTLPIGSGSPAWFEHRSAGLIGPEATHSLPVHPTQLYESLLGGLLLVMLLLARKRQRFRGEIFFLFTFGYGVCRFLLELLRADPERGELSSGLAPHVLIPFCLLLFAAGYAFGFARRIENDLFRRLTQAVAFVPAVASYLAMRPASFGQSAPSMPLSTSQFIALLSSVAVCAAYGVFYKAALTHPESAMALGLPEGAADGAAGAEPSAEPAERDGKDRAAKVKTGAARKPHPAAGQGGRSKGRKRKPAGKAPAAAEEPKKQPPKPEPGPAAPPDEDEDEVL
jgi:phosphatidylglycerol---prolipoprotein diacylglyceryl transferase